MVLLYESIRDQLIEEIVSGQLSVHDMFPSMRQLCSRFKVSHITVLHVLRELNERGFIERKGRGYCLCRQCSAQSVSEEGDSLAELPIGLFLRPYRPHSGDNYFNEINLAVENELSFACKYVLRGFMTREFNYKIAFSQEECDRMLRNLLLLDGRCSGILIDERVPDCVLERYLGQKHRPAVLINRPSSLPISSISISAVESAALLWSKVSQLGYTDIILFANPTMRYANDGLFYHACMEMASKGAEDNLRLHAIRNDERSTSAMMSSLLRQLESLRPTARPFFLFTVNEQAFQFLDFMSGKPYAVGRDYGVCGYYMNADKREGLNLSAINVNTSYIGYAAVRLLLEKCAHPWSDSVQEIHCPLEFVLGETT